MDPLYYLDSQALVNTMVKYVYTTHRRGVLTVLPTNLCTVIYPFFHSAFKNDSKYTEIALICSVVRTHHNTTS